MVNRTRTASILFAGTLIIGSTLGVLSQPVHAIVPGFLQRIAPQLFGVIEPAAGPGNAHRIILWTSYEKLVDLSDSQLDLWKSRGVDGIVIQTRYLDEMGGIETWTGDPNDPLSSVPVEGADVHIKQRTLRDNRFTQRCHARGLSVYLGFYLSNFHNLSTPFKIWNDDAGWSQIVVPMVRGVAGAARLLGMDGIATDSEMYRSDDQTWNWNYPGVTQTEAIVRGLARQRGREFMNAVLAGFPNVTIINYRIEIPGDWEEKVQAQVNGIVGVWDKSVFPDFWNGIVDIGGFRAIHFLDPIFYKSWHIRSGWDEALDYNLKGVRGTLSQRWANWAYASPRFFLSPFAWIDPGPSAGSFDDARPPDYVATQLTAFHKWGEGNLFGLYAQHIDDFDYTPYVPAMQAASTPDPVQTGASLADSPGAEPAEPRTPGSSGVIPDTKRPGLDALRLERVASGLHEPTDAGFSSDGRLFITERAGGIAIVRDGRLSTDAAPTLDAVWTAGGNGLLAIAIDPQFERTRFIYVIYTVASRAGEPTFRLVRLREVHETFGERAVLLDGVPAARTRAAASLRFGPDGKLYAAFGAGGDPHRIGDLASYSGKILRLNGDGSTPSDQPLTTPVYAYGYSAPGGFDWQSATGALWFAGRDPQDLGRLRIVGPNEVRSMVRAEGASYPLPQATSPTPMAFYRGTLIPPLRGDLLVASGNEPTIRRIRFDKGNPTRVTSMDPLLENAGGVIRTLSVNREGAIYFCVNDELRVMTPTIDPR
jgi:glucose/arabinose dehydrogenase